MLKTGGGLRWEESQEFQLTSQHIVQPSASPNIVVYIPFYVLYTRKVTADLI